jgi:hypothetical protein
MNLRAVAALSIALTMPIVASTPAPGVAAPPSLDSLEKALLTSAEGPQGYTFSGKMVSASSAYARPSTDPCKNKSSDFVDGPGGTASVSFQKGKDGPTVSESISVIGAAAALDQIKQYRTVLERCPAGSDGTSYARLTIPQFGAEAVGVVVTVKATGKPTARVALAAVAHGDALAVFTTLRGDATTDAALVGLATAGVRKLKLAL